MRIALWVFISFVLVGSLATFIPSIMSLGAPKVKDQTSKGKIKAMSTKIFLYAALVYPIVFILSLFVKHFMDIDMLYFLSTYAALLVLVFCIWFFSE
ncbi:hypothetical protein VSO92_05565 [Myroides pelagicus]|uniref:hypothetical protein n=1 Tax=Myroides pelagicus TaxID=270914 RepID=UPI002DBF32EB|nr:hypothetical protein [Myroides pelagicus]MEC4113575.1 hypothetical protein [Myroides pelagicus]